MGDVLKWFADGLRPKRRRSLDDWMENEMWLSAQSSEAAGPFRFEAAAYQRGIAEAISNPDVQEVVMMTSAQVGKSTILRGMLGYYMEHDPSPILAVVPTDKVAVGFAADFVEPLIRDTPVLRKLFSTKDGRTQTATKKVFPGGTMSIVGANVPSNLAMRPIKVLLGDEVDRWNKSAGKEGSPVELAKARTATYKATRKLVFVSTPTQSEISTISAMYDKSDKRRFFVPCHECGEFQTLEWDRVHYRKGHEAEALFACTGCGCLWNEFEKRAAVRKGEWRVTNPGATVVGFQLSALYSPWVTMAEMAIDFEAARGKPDKEQTFWNVRLGLPWSGDMTARATADLLGGRREVLPRGRLAPFAALLTAGVDVQRDRIEVMVWGFGPEDESWLVDHHVVYGDPAGPRIWADLEQWLLRVYAHPLGFSLPIEAVAIDSGDGVFTQTVYDFCAKNQLIGREWLAIKGVQQGPIWTRSKQKFANRPMFKLYLVGQNDSKMQLYQRFMAEEPGPAYVHIPDWVDDNLLEQMTSEWARVEYDDHGFSRLVWEKHPGVRNEGLDMSCYAFAVYRHLDFDLKTRLRTWTQPKIESLDPEAIGRMFA